MIFLVNPQWRYAILSERLLQHLLTQLSLRFVNLRLLLNQKRIRGVLHLRSEK